MSAETKVDRMIAAELEREAEDPPMTTGTTPKPRVVRWEARFAGVWSEMRMPGSLSGTELWERIRDGRFRAIVAIPRECPTCGGARKVSALRSLTGGGLGVAMQPCEDCDGTGRERCPVCAVVAHESGAFYAEACRDRSCVRGFLHGEREVLVRDALEKGIAGLTVASGIVGSALAAAVLTALIGDAP